MVGGSSWIPQLTKQGRVLTWCPGLDVNFKVNCIMTELCNLMSSDADRCTGRCSWHVTLKLLYNGHWTLQVIMRTETRIWYQAGSVHRNDSLKVSLICQGAKRFYRAKIQLQRYVPCTKVVNADWIWMKAIIGLSVVFFGCCSLKIAGAVKALEDH